MKDNAWQLEWQRGSLSTATQTYLDLGLKPTSRARFFPELRLRKEIQGWIIAARSGHGQPHPAASLASGCLVFSPFDQINIHICNFYPSPRVNPLSEPAFVFPGISSLHITFKSWARNQYDANSSPSESWHLIHYFMVFILFCLHSDGKFI